MGNNNESNMAKSDGFGAGNAPKESKVKKLLLNNKLIILLLLLLLIVFAWGQIKLNKANRDADKKIEEISVSYNLKFDSLQLASKERMSKVFSWSVRSELIRENVEQVAVLINNYVQEEGVKNVKLINPTSQMVVLSTNKREENRAFESPELLNLNQLEVHQTEETLIHLIPIMGLNQRMAILVVEYISEKNVTK
ncbi:hypothetical protein ACFFF3_14875 [Mongoliitalea lutea]|uniref:Uncharacterized protein n=2 Tax=Mongoliitalea lutea TaxID=849756 RepID=A0A8J3CVQ7_9BACT|nr:hypothetical protein GCM10008106_03700 [Mongoliitalea lutea]